MLLLALSLCLHDTPHCIHVGSQSSDEPEKKILKKLSKPLSWQGNYSFAKTGPNHAAGLKYYMRNEVMDQKTDFIWGWEWTASLKHDDDEFAGKSRAINGQVVPPLRSAASPSSETTLPKDEAPQGVRHCSTP